ncbi:MAG: MoaD/ThiS family protein [Acidobacteria bacterium]|jgi:molybdopterin converting factor small subunit|nr:MoaD/ThiS family protein [Acidobacteriota bacterium]
MIVEVLFFGATAEATGERAIEFSLSENVNADEAFAAILKSFPGLQQNFKNSLLFAVNQEYSGGDKIIKNGDELAVFTAVSGG